MRFDFYIDDEYPASYLLREAFRSLEKSVLTTAELAEYIDESLRLTNKVLSSNEDMFECWDNTKPLAKRKWERA